MVPVPVDPTSICMYMYNLFPIWCDIIIKVRVAGCTKIVMQKIERCNFTYFSTTWENDFICKFTIYFRLGCDII